LIWIPTCANTFSVEGYNLTKGECAKLAVLDEGDHVGHWPQIRNSNVGVYFKRSWVHKRNGTHRVHHDVPHDIPHLNVKGARRDPHMHEICEGNGRHCKHYEIPIWVFRIMELPPCSIIAKTPKQLKRLIKSVFPSFEIPPLYGISRMWNISPCR